MDEKIVVEGSVGVPPEIVEACARAAHEANRAHCLAAGDESQAPWDDAPDWQKVSCRKGVLGVLVEGNGPRESHASWLEEKLATGWRHGPEKDAAKKEHPCMVSYDELPPQQRAKDDVFVAVVRAVGRANGVEAKAPPMPVDLPGAPRLPTIDVTIPGLRSTAPQRPSRDDVDEMFTYHPPTPDQVPRYAAIRAAAKDFARVLLLNAPSSADRTAAIRKLRECVMTVNASIALERA